MVRLWEGRMVFVRVAVRGGDTVRATETVSVCVNMDVTDLEFVPPSRDVLTVMEIPACGCCGTCGRFVIVRLC